jgi:hypothetical protein
MRVEFIGRSFPRGLTYSYNLSYRRFLEGEYRFLILANNDIVVPQGAIASLARCLARHPFVGALTRKGDKTVFANQAVEEHYEITQHVTDDPANVQLVQDMVQRAPFQSLFASHIYGFCFGVSRDIIQFQYASGYLFNPSLLNTDQEYDLSSRTGGGHISLNTFIFHHKGISTGVRDIQAAEFVETRNNLLSYHGSGIDRRLRVIVGGVLHIFQKWDARIRRRLHGAFHKLGA